MVLIGMKFVCCAQSLRVELTFSSYSLLPQCTSQLLDDRKRVSLRATTAITMLLISTEQNRSRHLLKKDARTYRSICKHSVVAMTHLVEYRFGIIETQESVRPLGKVASVGNNRDTIEFTRSVYNILCLGTVFTHICATWFERSSVVVVKKEWHNFLAMNKLQKYLGLGSILPAASSMPQMLLYEDLVGQRTSRMVLPVIAPMWWRSPRLPLRLRSRIADCLAASRSESGQPTRSSFYNTSLLVSLSLQNILRKPIVPGFRRTLVCFSGVNWAPARRNLTERGQSIVFVRLSK